MIIWRTEATGHPVNKSRAEAGETGEIRRNQFSCFFFTYERPNVSFEWELNEFWMLEREKEKQTCGWSEIGQKCVSHAQCTREGWWLCALPQTLPFLLVHCSLSRILGCFFLLWLLQESPRAQIILWKIILYMGYENSFCPKPLNLYCFQRNGEDFILLVE